MSKIDKKSEEEKRERERERERERGDVMRCHKIWDARQYLPYIHFKYINLFSTLHSVV